MTALVDGHDAALFDLDGVVYLGEVAVPAAAGTIAALRDRTVPCGFVTNNASRTPRAVADHLTELGIAATAEDVITSAQAVARMLEEQFDAGSPMFVLGADALVDEVVGAGMRPVGSADDHPVAVVQGLYGELRWSDLCEGAVAIQRGAVWIAANTDTTRPTERGLYPGCGAAVAALRLAVDVDPQVAGKPYPPLMVETMRRMACRRPIFVGDRLDTDIAGAHGIGIDSLFVLSGAHGVAELLAAGPERRPTHLGADLAALLDPARTVTVEGDRAGCGDQQVSVHDGRYAWPSPPISISGVLDLVWATAQLHWQRVDAGTVSDVDTVVVELNRLLRDASAATSTGEKS